MSSNSSVVTYTFIEITWTQGYKIHYWLIQFNYSVIATPKWQCIKKCLIVNWISLHDSIMKNQPTTKLPFYYLAVYFSVEEGSLDTTVEKLSGNFLLAEFNELKFFRWLLGSLPDHFIFLIRPCLNFQVRHLIWPSPC